MTESPFAIETIPDADAVFRALHKMWFRQGVLASGKAFKFDKDGCSVDWAKYSNPDSMRAFSTTHPPQDYGVGELIVREIRRNEMLLHHAPRPERRAHSLIIPHANNPEDIKECQMRLLENCTVVLTPVF